MVFLGHIYNPTIFKEKAEAIDITRSFVNIDQNSHNRDRNSTT